MYVTHILKKNSLEDIRNIYRDRTLYHGNDVVLQKSYIIPRDSISKEDLYTIDNWEHIYKDYTAPSFIVIVNGARTFQLLNDTQLHALDFHYVTKYFRLEFSILKIKNGFYDSKPKMSSTLLWKKKKALYSKQLFKPNIELITNFFIYWNNLALLQKKALNKNTKQRLCLEFATYYVVNLVDYFYTIEIIRSVYNKMLILKNGKKLGFMACLKNRRKSRFYYRKRVTFFYTNLYRYWCVFVKYVKYKWNTKRFKYKYIERKLLVLEYIFFYLRQRCLFNKLLRISFYNFTRRCYLKIVRYSYNNTTYLIKRTILYYKKRQLPFKPFFGIRKRIALLTVGISTHCIVQATAIVFCNDCRYITMHNVNKKKNK